MWAVDLYFIDLLMVDTNGFLNSTFATAFKLINQVFTAQAIGGFVQFFYQFKSTRYEKENLFQSTDSGKSNRLRI